MKLPLRNKLRTLFRKYWKFGILAISPLLVWYIFCLPRPLFADPLSVVIEDETGTLLSAQIARDGQWRFPQMDSLPSKYKTALLTFEDKRFYQHIGVDFRALGRAILQNIRNGSVVSGASTIDMQVIRLARKQKKRSLWNKLIEIILATRLEISFSKEKILNLYATHAPFGGNVVGLDAASWRYFGKSAHLLSWSESATLAVLPNSPGLIHPGRNRMALRAKRDRLLGRMLSNGKIDSLTYELAIEEALPQKPLPLPQYAPHLLQRVAKDYRNGSISIPKIRTSLQLELQQTVNQRIIAHQQITRHNQIYNAAALVIHIPTNQVVAYVGNVPGAGNEHGEMVDVIKAPRSTGSILKPFLYALALEDGAVLPQSLLSDTPINYNGYRPENFNHNYQGAIAADEALARSLNIPFVNLLQTYGLDRFHLGLKKLGMETLTQPPDHYGLTLILGGAEASLWDITSMYAQLGRTLSDFNQNSSQYDKVLARKPSYIAGAGYPRKKISWQKEPPAYGAGAAWYTLKAMEEVKRPSSEGEWQVFRSSQNISWKTGTSFGFRDAWAVGLTPDYAVGVWVGNADGEGRPGLVGVQAAAPLLFEIFRLLPERNGFSTPYDDLRPSKVCQKSGLLAGNHCPIDSVGLPDGLPPQTSCSYHKLIHLDQSGKYQVTSSCVSPLEMQHQSWFILPPLQAHYYRNYNPDYRTLPSFSPNCKTADRQQKMELIYPREATRIYVPLNLDGTLSRTVFEVAHTEEQMQLYWHIDETYIGVTKQFHSMEFNPTPGPHLLTVVDERGERLEQRFEIIAKEE